jgi:hypothetical protein
MDSVRRSNGNPKSYAPKEKSLAHLVLQCKKLSKKIQARRDTTL